MLILHSGEMFQGAELKMIVSLGCLLNARDGAQHFPVNIPFDLHNNPMGGEGGNGEGNRHYSHFTEN